MNHYRSGEKYYTLGDIEKLEIDLKESKLKIDFLMCVIASAALNKVVSVIDAHNLEQQAKGIARAVVNVTPNKCKRSYSEKRLQAYAQKLILEAQKLKGGKGE